MGGKAPVKLIVSLGCQAIPLSTRARTCLLPSHSTRTGGGPSLKTKPKQLCGLGPWPILSGIYTPADALVTHQTAPIESPCGRRS
jgi:hypothetical protein